MTANHNPRPFTATTMDKTKQTAGFSPNDSFNHERLSEAQVLPLALPSKINFISWVFGMMIARIIELIGIAIAVHIIDRDATTFGGLLMGYIAVALVALVIESGMAFSHFKALAYMNRFLHPVFYGVAYVIYPVFLVYSLIYVTLAPTPVGPLPPQKMPIKGLTLTTMGISLIVILFALNGVISDLRSYGVI